MKKLLILLASALPYWFPGTCAAADIVGESGVAGGLVVHLGCGDGELTMTLRPNASYLVQGLDTDIANVEKARQRIKSAGLLGKISAATFDGEHLPYTDNLVNLLVVGNPCGVSRGEMVRVLAPDGVLMEADGEGWKLSAKPHPNNIDQWTHYLHGPDNNAVARDMVVGPPRHMQWLAGPRWTRHHHTLNSISSVVTAGGRLFTIADEATAANMAVPGKWSIVARDAFSGVELWRRPMATWASQKTRFRSGPPQVTRLLVAVKDRISLPLELNAPISALDAATGKTLEVFEQTVGAEEMLLVGDVLLVLKGSPVAEHAVAHAAFSADFKSPNSKSLVAINAESGKTLWQWSDPNVNPMPETLGCDGQKVYFQVNQSVTCLDFASGREQWTFGERGNRPSANRGFGKYVLVVSDGVVLCKLGGNLTAISADDGKLLWETPAGSGFHAPLDVFVIDGIVWQSSHVSDSVAPPPVDDFDKGRDLHTGEVKSENSILVDLQTSGHHHRCYREKATVRFIITGKRGIEMMDLMGDDHSRNNWVRGTCQYGILPANGMLYAPAHACGCYMESKLWGFFALAPQKASVQDAKFEVPREKRLRRGPAYGNTPADGTSSGSLQSWPQYRQNPRRSGIAATELPAKLQPAWKAEFGGTLTQPVIAGGKVVFSVIDEHTVYALDEKTGQLAWQYVAGGRVDSPPALHQGMALFGSADGRVTCLRLADGELMWRFLAAPADLKTVAMEQVESLWPVHGSVLVLDNVAYCSAGRSTWLDGGIDLYGLEPATGRVVYNSRYRSRHPKIHDGLLGAKPEHVKRVSQNTTDSKTYLAPDRSDSFSMAGGAVTDVLSSDGKNVFMHHAKFNAELEPQAALTRHLFSTSGMLDGSENHRSHWVLGTGDFSLVPVAYSWIANAPGRRSPTIAVPNGLMMVYDDRAVWVVRRKGTSGAYTLLERDNAPFSDNDKSLPDFRAVPKEQANPSNWTADLTGRPRAMLKTGNVLVFGTMPTTIGEDDPRAAYEGRGGGAIRLVSAVDGAEIASYPIDAPVVWDGMAAANGRLFFATENGGVQCWGGE